MDAVRVHLTYRLTAFNGDRGLTVSYVRCQLLLQRAMPCRNFDYLLYVLFSVQYMNKTPINQDSSLLLLVLAVRIYTLVQLLCE